MTEPDIMDVARFPVMRYQWNYVRSAIPMTSSLLDILRAIPRSRTTAARAASAKENSLSIEVSQRSGPRSWSQEQAYVPRVTSVKALAERA